MIPLFGGCFILHFYSKMCPPPLLRKETGVGRKTHLGRRSVPWSGSHFLVFGIQGTAGTLCMRYKISCVLTAQQRKRQRLTFPFHFQEAVVKRNPKTVECFLEDLFLGSQWSIILGYRRLSVKFFFYYSLFYNQETIDETSSSLMD